MASNQRETAVDDVIESLDRFGRLVVDLRYGHGHDLQQISTALASTPTRVSAALMNAYRRVSTAVEGGNQAASR